MKDYETPSIKTLLLIEQNVGCDILSYSNPNDNDGNDLDEDWE